MIKRRVAAAVARPTSGHPGQPGDSDRRHERGRRAEEEALLVAVGRGLNACRPKLAPPTRKPQTSAHACNTAPRIGVVQRSTQCGSSTANAVTIRMTVSPSAEGTTSRLHRYPNQPAPIITVVRTAADRPSSASPIDHAPATPTASQKIRGPHNSVSAASNRDPGGVHPPRLADRSVDCPVAGSAEARFGSCAACRGWNYVAEEVTSE